MYVTACDLEKLKLQDPYASRFLSKNIVVNTCRMFPEYES